MCLLKVYVEDSRFGGKLLLAGNVAHISADEESFRILDVEGREKIISGVGFLMIDALNSIFVLRIKGELKIDG
ncbi:MAG: hypothetical protein QXX56_03675 [Candidatus Bathyarchaeia archaeon]